jgi:hypothetical protein
MSKIHGKLLNIQGELKAPKSQTNEFGHYNYRSAEDILEAVKPLCLEYGAVTTLSDKIQLVNERYYIEATATITDIETGDSISVSAYAREEETKKGMDASQITGSASSYARKYALNGLFCIDDTKDADTNEQQKIMGQGDSQGNKNSGTKSKNNPQKPPTPAEVQNSMDVAQICKEIQKIRVALNIGEKPFNAAFKEKYGVDYFEADIATLQKCLTDMKKKNGGKV